MKQFLGIFGRLSILRNELLGEPEVFDCTLSLSLLFQLLMAMVADVRKGPNFGE